MAAEHKCSLEDISSCPSARIIKVFLKRMDKWKQTHYSDDKSYSDNEPPSDLTQTVHKNESQIAQSLISSLDEHDYSVTKLLDDLHHLKYEHNIDGNDDRFDAAYDFFKDSMTGNVCDIDKCPFIQRHHRDRGRQRNVHQIEDKEDLLMDTMAMIHCYFLHSFETQRFTKEERQRMIKLTDSVSWASVKNVIVSDDIDDGKDHEEDSDDDEDSIYGLLMTTVTEIVTSKRQKGRNRFRHDNEDEKVVMDDNTVDFTAMSVLVGIDEVILKEALSEYQNDQNQLIGALIDVVYGEKCQEMEIWSKLKVEADDKSKTFRAALFDHFQCLQLNTPNLIKMFRFIIDRKRLQIDIEGMEEVVTSNDIDGRLFDKSDSEHYQNNGTFAKRFKGIPDCKMQHVRQLYTAVRKWKYVEVKKVAVESKEEGKEDDMVEPGQQGPDVYAIGKRFNFWQKRNDDYVQAKYKDMKEEVLQSPLLSVHFVGVIVWNKLMTTITAMVGTQAALKIRSNGRKRFLYRIKKDKPFDERHLGALKLYTDFTKLCATLCVILRQGNPAQIAQIANWTKTLVETIQCYGTPLSDESAKRTYFRGVNRTFMFMTIVSRFNLPQSTTSSVKYPGPSIPVFILLMLP